TSGWGRAGLGARPALHVGATSTAATSAPTSCGWGLRTRTHRSCNCRPAIFKTRLTRTAAGTSDGRGTRTSTHPSAGSSGSSLTASSDEAGFPGEPLLHLDVNPLCPAAQAGGVPDDGQRHPEDFPIVGDLHRLFGPAVHVDILHLDELLAVAHGVTLRGV